MTSNDRWLHYGCEAVEQAPTIQQAQFPILCSLQKFCENKLESGGVYFQLKGK